MKKQSMIFGAGILSLGALVSRALGALYRIPLTRILGARGTGLYQLIFPVFALFVVISTTGMPLAISRLIARAKDDEGKKRQIIRKSFFVITLISSIFAILLCILCKYIARWQGEEGIWLAYICIAPAIILVGGISVLRGYFQGEKCFAPTALSQIIEQIFKIVVGLSLSVLFLQYGLIYAVVGAIVGVTISEVAAVIFLYARYRFSRKGQSIADTTKVVGLSREMWKIALPILASAILLPIANVIDSFVVINILKNYFSTSMSTAIYGIESGVVGAILNLPTVISFALASVLLPSIESSDNEEKLKTKLQQVFTTNLAIVLPCVIGFIIFASPIISLLYGKGLSVDGLDGVALASSLLAISSIGIFYMSFAQIFSATLQGTDRAKVALRNLIISIIVKFAIQIPLMLMPGVNIYGVVFGNLACFICDFALDYFSVRDLVQMDNVVVVKILLSTALSLFVIYFAHILMPSNLGFIFSLLIGGGIYCILSFSFGVIDLGRKKMLKKNY